MKLKIIPLKLNIFGFKLSNLKFLILYKNNEKQPFYTINFHLHSRIKLAFLLKFDYKKRNDCVMMLLFLIHARK